MKISKNKNNKKRNNKKMMMIIKKKKDCKKNLNEIRKRKEKNRIKKIKILIERCLKMKLKEENKTGIFIFIFNIF